MENAKMPLKIRQIFGKSLIQVRGFGKSTAQTLKEHFGIETVGDFIPYLYFRSKELQKLKYMGKGRLGKARAWILEESGYLSLKELVLNFDLKLPGKREEEEPSPEEPESELPIRKAVFLRELFKNQIREYLLEHTPNWDLDQWAHIYEAFAWQWIKEEKIPEDLILLVDLNDDVFHLAIEVFKPFVDRIIEI